MEEDENFKYLTENDEIRGMVGSTRNGDLGTRLKSWRQRLEGPRVVCLFGREEGAGRGGGTAVEMGMAWVELVYGGQLHISQGRKSTDEVYKLIQ